MTKYRAVAQVPAQCRIQPEVLNPKQAAAVEAMKVVSALEVAMRHVPRGDAAQPYLRRLHQQAEAAFRTAFDSALESM